MASPFEDGDLYAELDGQARAERAELVRWLLDEGFDPQDIASAVNPMLLATNRVLGDDGVRISIEDVARRNGVSVDVVARLYQAVGLAQTPDAAAPVYSRADVEAVLPAAGLVEMGIELEHVILVVRLLMHGLTKASVAMRYGGLKTIVNPGVSEKELAEELSRLTAASRPLIDAMIKEISLLALRQSFETEAITFAERSSGRLPGARMINVAFADVVGFTRLGEELPLEELRSLVDGLVDITLDVVTAPVRFVKTIGDAVMLVSTDAVPLIGVVKSLLRSARESDLQLRSGIASGLAMSRAGDWYGSPVNLASRITDATPPGALWIADSTRDAIGDIVDFRFELAGVRRFRGVSNIARLFAVMDA